MRVLVTGASGFVGRPLVGSLAAEGHDVAQLVLAEEACQLQGVASCLVADLRCRSSVVEAFDTFQPEAVFHLGGLSEVGSSWQRIDEHFEVNLMGTRTVLAAAGSDCRVLFASSAEVYGRLAEDEIPVDEGKPPRPASPYALAKAAAELFALDAGAIVVRSFNLIGAGQASRFALPSFAQQLCSIVRGDAEPTLRVGNLSARRDFVHVLDGVAAYQVLLSAGEPGGIYNLASGRAVSLADMLDRLIAISGAEVEVETDPERMRPVDVPVLCGDAGRLRALGWEPARGIDEALRDLWQEVSDQYGTRGSP